MASGALCPLYQKKIRKTPGAHGLGGSSDWRFQRRFQGHWVARSCASLPAAAYHRLPDLTPDGHARDAHVDAGAEQEVDPRLLRRRELVARSLHLRCRDTPRPPHPGSRLSQTTIHTCIFHLYKPLIYIIYINHIADANAGA